MVNEGRRTDQRRVAGSALPARRHLGRRGCQFLAVLRQCRPRSSCACSTVPAGTKSSASSCASAPTTTGMSTFRRHVRACCTAIACTGRTIPSAATVSIRNKLLIEPYAKHLQGSLQWSDAHFGYRTGHAKADLSFDRRDSAPFTPKCRVVDSAFTWGDDRPPRIPWHDTIIYEAHVKGLSIRHPEVPPHLRGTYRRTRHRADRRSPGEPGRHRRRADAGACLRRRPAAARERAAQLLGLQHARLLRPGDALFGQRSG